MPALIQICIVIVTVGLLAIVLMTARLMARLIRVTEELSQLTRAVRKSVVGFDRFTYEAGALVASLRECVPPVQRAVDRFEAVGQRTADLSNTLLKGLELPIYAAAAVASGARWGAKHFLKRIVRRLIHRQSPIHGGR